MRFPAFSQNIDDDVARTNNQRQPIDLSSSISQKLAASYPTTLNDNHDVLTQDAPPYKYLNKQFVVFILPRNPGLISFYNTFAAGLSSILKTRSRCQKATINICGKYSPQVRDGCRSRDCWPVVYPPNHPSLLDETRTTTENKCDDSVWGSGLSNNALLYIYSGLNANRPKQPNRPNNKTLTFSH